MINLNLDVPYIPKLLSDNFDKIYSYLNYIQNNQKIVKNDKNNTLVYQKKEEYDKWFKDF